jgi:hypothetical protein
VLFARHNAVVENAFAYSPTIVAKTQALIERLPVVLNQHIKEVIAGLVPAIPIIRLGASNRGSPDKPGHDWCGKLVQHDRNPL